MSIAIIDYGMGNLRSVSKAFESLGKVVTVTSDKKVIQKAEKVVLPGVGAFRDAMDCLKKTNLDSVIKEVVAEGKPFLGICLGMQLLFETSYENGKYEGLGILPGEIQKIEVPLKVPHMGWNTLSITKKQPLLEGIGENPHMYFVHSYHVQTTEEVVSSYTHYGIKIVASVQKDNVYGMQFHPEKSSAPGLQILQNFGGLTI